MNKTRWTYLAVAAAGAAGAYGLYRLLTDGAPRLSRNVRNRLPISQDFDTIRDDEGNYDLDGVSFDIEGVIISSDGVKSVISPI